MLSKIASNGVSSEFWFLHWKTLLTFLGAKVGLFCSSLSCYWRVFLSYTEKNPKEKSYVYKISWVPYSLYLILEHSVFISIILNMVLTIFELLDLYASSRMWVKRLNSNSSHRCGSNGDKQHHGTKEGTELSEKQWIAGEGQTGTIIWLDVY